ncbi:MAG: hypothetical protein M3Q51_06175 [Pseudomonadota bacterium]|nr:hypothetical protein [Pseudomonadota bacterium]
MSQRAALQALDASIITAFATVGFADAAVYTPPSGIPVDCRVYVDNVAQFFGGDSAEVAGYRTTVTLFRSDVLRPIRGATVFADGVTHTLDQLDAQDESMSRWVVLP